MEDPRFRVARQRTPEEDAGVKQAEARRVRADARRTLGDSQRNVWGRDSLPDLLGW